MPVIDINADLGEGGPHDEALLEIVSSCNIACGGHAGDPESMAKTLRHAIRNNVAVGAHPGYPDKEGFGRSSRFLTGNALYESLRAQVEVLADIAALLGTRLTHVKPHGALYADAASSADLAEIVARVTAEAPAFPALVAAAGSELERAAARHHVLFRPEGFVDRAYEADGSLVSRSEPAAVHTDLAVITAQAVSLATEECVTARSGEQIMVRSNSLCIHGDTPNAPQIARAVRDVLEQNGVEIRANG